MDELKAIEKTVSELKTIQNRLIKVHKEKDWALSVEIPRLNALISEKEDECKTAQKQLNSLTNNIESLNEIFRSTKLSLQDSQKGQKLAEKEVEKLKAEIRELKSDYVYRSMKAKNQFLEEKLDRLKGKLVIQEKAALGNYKNFEKVVDQFRYALELEIIRLENRNNELEKMNDELLKENIKLRKQ